MQQLFGRYRWCARYFVAAGEAVESEADVSLLEAVFYDERLTLNRRFYKDLEEGS